MTRFVLALFLPLSLAACSSPQNETNKTKAFIYDYGKITVQPSAIEHALTFGFDSTELTDEHRVLLKPHINHLILNPSLSVRVQGRADSAGSFDYNYDLGLQRAQRIKAYLIAEGIEPKQILMSSISELAERRAPRRSVVLSY